MRISQFHRPLLSSLLILVAIVVFSGPVWAEQEPVDVAVLNMEGRNVPGELLQTLTGVLRHEAQQNEKYAVVNPAPINLSEIVVVLGCNPEAVSCLRQAAEYIEARVLIYGQVERKARGYFFTVEIFDAPTGRVIHQLSRTLEESDDPVITFGREIEGFFAAQDAVPASRLQIGSTVDGAEIRIEGMLVGTAPFERTGLDAGRYNVEVSAPGYTSWKVVVEIIDGAEVRLWAPLVEEVVVVPGPPLDPYVAPDPEPTPTPVHHPVVVRPPDTVPTSTNWGAWGMIGVGTAALGGSVAMAVMMRNVEAEIQDDLANLSRSEARYEELVAKGKSYETSHRVLLGVGGVSLTAGVLWLVLSRRHEKLQARGPLQFHVGPTEIGATLRF
ncbi:MAG: PEGA domain-containing protein [Bradymonadaceae bacterium]